MSDLEIKIPDEVSEQIKGLKVVFIEAAGGPSYVARATKSFSPGISVPKALAEFKKARAFMRAGKMVFDDGSIYWIGCARGYVKKPQKNDMPDGLIVSGCKTPFTVNIDPEK
jgi:hypothetical protein